jgi:hypothetical protein
MLLFRILLVLIISIPPVALHGAQQYFSWTTQILHAYESSVALDFEKASTLCTKEKSDNPLNLLPIYIESHIDFYKTFLEDTPENIAGIKKRNAARIQLLDKFKGNSPYTRFCKGEMYLQLAISSAREEAFFTAAYDIRKAYKLLEENQRLFPDFKANLRGLGLIHTAVGTIPKNYQWIVNMMGLDGSIQEGLSELKSHYTATLKNPEFKIMRDEAIVILTFMELNFGKSRDFNTIRKRYTAIAGLQEKPVLLFSKSTLHFAAAENDSVIHLLSKRERNLRGQPLHYLDFMEANARLYNLDLSAEKNYLYFLQHYKGQLYVKTALRRIAWIHLLKNDLKGYKHYISRCTSSGKDDLSEEDKAAIRESEQAEPPNVILVRAGLLFDGGYYQRALAELTGKKPELFPGIKNQLEFTYRLARIFDKTEKYDKALSLYESTYKNGLRQPYYFAANSALLIGQHYEDIKNKDKAVEWYNKTLEIRNHEYQNSIDQKAKAGINRLSP